MSLMSLLRHVGIDVPRAVTVNGRVLTGRPAVAAVGLGTATAVVPHVFHGGPADLLEPRLVAMTGAGTSQAWWDDPSARARDVSAVNSAFPARRYACFSSPAATTRHRTCRRSACPSSCWNVEGPCRRRGRGVHVSKQRSAQEALDDHLAMSLNKSVEDDIARNYAVDVVVVSNWGVE